MIQKPQLAWRQTMKQLCKLQEVSEAADRGTQLLSALKCEVKAKDTMLKQKLKKQFQRI